MTVRLQESDQAQVPKPRYREAIRANSLGLPRFAVTLGNESKEVPTPRGLRRFLVPLTFGKEDDHRVQIPLLRSQSRHNPDGVGGHFLTEFPG